MTCPFIRGVAFPDGGLDGPHADLFGRVAIGGHGVCRKKQVNPTNVEDSGFQTS